MNNQPFHRVAVLTDAHWGRRNASPEAIQDNLNFIDWFCDEARTWGADICISMGDWTHHRSSIGLETLDASLRGMEKLSQAFKKVYFILGNHDLFYRTRRDITSTAFSTHLPNFIYVNNPLTVGDVTFLPWLIEGEHDIVKHTKSRYIFGHLELNGFKMNSRVVMPDHEGALSAADFAHVDYLFSGHFHHRQSRGRALYIGNIMPFNHSDDFDDDRGMMLLEWGKEPEFRAWPGQPTFRSGLLSDIMGDPQKYLRSGATVQAMQDFDMSFEDKMDLKELMLRDYSLRKFTIMPSTENKIDEENSIIEPGKPIDEIVIEGLRQNDSVGIDAERLAAEYEALAIPEDGE